MDNPFHDPLYFREYVFFQKTNSLQLSSDNLSYAREISKSLEEKQLKLEGTPFASCDLINLLLDNLLRYTDINLQSHFLYHALPIEINNSELGIIENPHKEIKRGLAILGQTFPFYKIAISGENSKITIRGSNHLYLLFILLSYLSFSHKPLKSSDESGSIDQDFLLHLKEERDWTAFSIKVKTQCSDDYLYIEYTDSMGTSIIQFDELLGKSRRAYFDWLIYQMNANVSDLSSGNPGINIRIPIH